MKQALFKGDLRRLVKRYQVLETADEKRVFQGMMNTAKQTLKRIQLDHRNDATAQEFLKKMTQTLDNVIVVTRMKKPRTEHREATKTLFKMIRKAIQTEDIDGILAH